MNCPHCAEPLAERGVFCKACAGQAKCIKCREVLEPGAVACVECGTRIGTPVDATDGMPTFATAAPASNRNTLNYQEDRNSRRFEASLTDSAMHGLGDVFAEKQ
jgi:predicted amidophosphoribosyltransferase